MKILVVMRDDMLKDALGNYVEFKPYYDFQSTRIICNAVKPRLVGTEIYPTKYLFGWHQKTGYTKGILQSYFDRGHDVCLMSEAKMESLTPQDFLSFDALDVQYATMPTNKVKQLLKLGVKIVGWTPPEFASKIVQAILVSQKCHKRPFLPKQILLPSNAMFSSELGRKCVKHLEAEFVILKGALSAASRIGGVIEYQITKKDLMIEVLSSFIEKIRYNTWDFGTIISELVITEDPFVGHANHVIHKANCISKFIENSRELEIDFVGGICQKIVSNGDLETVRKEGVLPLSKFIVSSHISKAHLSSIQNLNEFQKVIKFFGLTGCIFSVDFMISADGFSRFLELNKLAATFADIFDPNCDSALDQSAGLFDIEGLDPKFQLNCIERFEDEFEALKKEGFLTNPVIASKDGIQFLV
ncbi:MAG: hypothetical protein QW270_00430 [Candidatus Bathyarchaeia archaeon]